MSAGTEAGPKWRLRFQQNTLDLGGSGSETLCLQLNYSLLYTVHLEEPQMN